MNRLLPCLLLGACAGPGTGPRHDGPPLERLLDLPGDEGAPVFSPDASRIAFTRPVDGGVDLYVLQLGGRALTRVTSTPGASESDAGWTPDGEALLYEEESSHGSRILRTRLADLATTVFAPEARSPSSLRFSADHEEVLFTTREDDEIVLWTGDPRSDDATRRARAPGDFRPAGFSADRRGVIGTLVDGPEQDVARLDLATGELTRLTTHPHEEWSVSPAPVGDWIAFYSTYDGEMTDVRLVHGLTGETRRLTSSVWEDFGPSWSPDGERLAFLSDRDGKSGLWLLDVETGVETPLLPHTRVASFPVWSPDGRHIAFAYTPVEERLFRVRASGGDLEPLGPSGLEASSPVVSPDGSRLAFHTTDFASEGDVVVLDLASGDWRPVSSGYENVKEHSWSPRGDALAVRRNRGGWLRSGQVHVLDLTTGEDRQLTTRGWVRSVFWSGEHVYYSAPAPGDERGAHALWRVPVAGGTEQLARPAPARPRGARDDGAVLYSTRGPDGHELRWLLLDEIGAVVSDELAVSGSWSGRAACDGRIAYLSSEDGRPDLHVVAPSGEHVRLTSTPWHESTPDWSADGEWVYFSARADDRDLYRVEVR